MKYLLLFFFPLSLFAGEYKAKVTSVYDGDTITVTVKLGLDVSIDSSMRLYGINAPELRTGKAGKDAKEFLSKQILGKEIVIVTNDKKEREKYGRILGKVFLDGVCVNDLMVTSGYAVKYLED